MNPRRRAIVLKLYPIASIYSWALNLAKRAVRKLFNTIGGFLDQKSVPTFGISCRDSISQNSISSHGIELNLSGLSRYIKYSAKQSFLTSQTCSKVDFSMNQYWVFYTLEFPPKHMGFSPKPMEFSQNLWSTKPMEFLKNLKNLWSLSKTYGVYQKPMEFFKNLWNSLKKHEKHIKSLQNPIFRRTRALF